MLTEIFNKHNSDKSMKHMYHLVYEQHFDKIRHDELNILEVGIFKGESIKAWLEYFPNSTIYGVDIFERVRAENIEVLNHPRVKWAKCDSTISNVSKWDDVKFDIIIDDGLHTPDANAKTFNSFKHQLRGMYFIEDVWPLDIMNKFELNHSWIKNNSEYTIEKYKNFINKLNEFGTIEYFDLRKSTKQPDSYIIKIVK